MSEYPCHNCGGDRILVDEYEDDFGQFQYRTYRCRVCQGSGIQPMQCIKHERKDGMNYSTLLFLINKDLRAVAGIYEAEEEKGQKPVPRAIFKTLDPELKVGDYVLVPTGGLAKTNQIPPNDYSLVSLTETGITLAKQTRPA